MKDLWCGDLLLVGLHTTRISLPNFHRLSAFSAATVLISLQKDKSVIASQLSGNQKIPRDY